MGNLIYMVRLIRKNKENKEIIKQSRLCLEEIQKKKEQIELQGSEKILFLISLIHEIKIPLTIIQNSLYQYFDKSKKDDKNLIAMKSNIKILYRDIINILDAEKTNQAQQIYNNSTILNVSDATTKVIEVFKYNMNQKKIALT